MSRESLDNESCYSSIHVDEFVDADEEDIAELDQIKEVEAKVNALGETSEELHCLSGDLIAKKMVHEKRNKHL